MPKKTWDVPERDIRILQQVMEENGFNTQTQALVHIIESYKKEQEKEELKAIIYEEVNQQVRMASSGALMCERKIEGMVNVLMDLANSYLLLKENDLMQFIPTSVVKATFIKKSEEKYKSILGELKRKKEHKKN